MKLWKALAKIESCFLQRKIDAYMETMGYVGIEKQAHETNSSYFQENLHRLISSINTKEITSIS